MTVERVVMSRQLNRRYRKHGTWEVLASYPDGVEIEVADVIDTWSSRIYQDDARRVRVDGHLVRGKGGSVPFIGETAWMDADRLASDIAVSLRHKGEAGVTLCKGVK